MYFSISKFSITSVVTTKNLYAQLCCGAAPWDALVAGVWTMPGGWPAGEDTVVTPPPCTSLSSAVRGPGTLLHSSASCRESVIWLDLIPLCFFSQLCCVVHAIFYSFYSTYCILYVLLFFVSSQSVFFTALLCQLWNWAVFYLCWLSLHHQVLFFSHSCTTFLLALCVLYTAPILMILFWRHILVNFLWVFTVLQILHFNVTTLVIGQLKWVCNAC